MSKAHNKADTITFKVDPELAEAMRGLPNRSAFIRRAVAAALQTSCPLCGGTGVLDAAQLEHWQRLARTHGLERCERCHAVHLVCRRQGDGEVEG